MPSDCRLRFKRAPPSLIIKDACSGGSLMNKSLGRDDDWSAASEQASIGTGADQPNQEEGTLFPPSVRAAVLLTERSCALCYLQTQFSFCHLAAPLCGWSSGARRPFAIVKDDVFFAWQVCTGDGSFRCSGGKWRNFQDNFSFMFCKTSSSQIDFACCEFASAATVIFSKIIRPLFIRLQFDGCNKVKINKKFQKLDINLVACKFRPQCDVAKNVLGTLFSFFFLNSNYWVLQFSTVYNGAKLPVRVDI